MEKFLKVMKFIVNVVLTLFIILGATFILLYFIGIEPFVVQSGSMSPEIETGSVSFINRREKYENIRVNDIIAFKTPNGNQVTHRVVSVTNNGLETKGDANERSDGISTTRDNFMGKNIYSIPKAGFIVKKIQSREGKLVTAGFIIVLFAAAFFLGKEPKGKHEEKCNCKHDDKCGCKKSEENKADVEEEKENNKDKEEQED